jgi:hypothetical protein
LVEEKCIQFLRNKGTVREFVQSVGVSMMQWIAYLAADGKAALDEKLNELKRRLTSAEAEEAATNEQEQQAEHSIHLNVEESILPASCVDCVISLAIIDSPTCNDTTAYDNAIKVDLQDALKYTTNEEGSTDGWISQTFRERQLDGDGENTDAPAITLADVLAISTEVIEAVNLFADADYKIAVYLHDPNEEPVACAALEPASDEDAKMYEDLFFPTAAGNEGEDEGAGGSDASVADAVPVGAMDSSSGDVLISSTMMVGMIMLMSVILLV